MVECSGLKICTSVISRKGSNPLLSAISKQITQIASYGQPVEVITRLYWRYSLVTY